MKNLNNLMIILILSLNINNIDGQQLEHIPVKVKTQKVEVTLHSGEEIKGYLVDVLKDTLFIVKQTSMVKGAIKNGCVTCSKIMERNIYDVKLKESSVTGIALGAAILGAGIIWSMGGDARNPDGISERAIRMMTFSTYGGGALAVILLYNSIFNKESFDLNTLKKKSSKIRFYRKCNETIRKFILHGSLNESYSFYIGDNFRLIKGRVVKKDAKGVEIILENSDHQISINNIDIKCVK